MLTVEEYIAKRKDEDNLNEWDVKALQDNTRTVVNYVFEYFNNYLNLSDLDHQTIQINKRAAKLKKQLKDYSVDIQDWLVTLYLDHDKHFHRSIITQIKKETLFFLFHSEKEFRGLSYAIFSELKGKIPSLERHSELLYQFIREYYQISNNCYSNPPIIIDEIDSWIVKTKNKYGVNLYNFALDWSLRFSDNTDLWPPKHKIRSSKDFLEYEYDYKQKRNLFNVDFIYKQVSDKPFMKGKKQLLETLILYCWLHEIVGDDDHYWDAIVKNSN